MFAVSTEAHLDLLFGKRLALAVGRHVMIGVTGGNSVNQFVSERAARFNVRAIVTAVTNQLAGIEPQARLLRQRSVFDNCKERRR